MTEGKRKRSATFCFPAEKRQLPKVVKCSLCYALELLDLLRNSSTYAGPLCVLLPLFRQVGGAVASWDAQHFQPEPSYRQLRAV